MVIAGTGHRPNKIGGYSAENFLKLTSLAEKTLIELKPNIVISGMALGWDQALAQAAINLEITFVAAIPCFNQEKMWSQEFKNKYSAMINHPLCTKHYVSNMDYTPDCMQKRNEWMVDNCNILLALWDKTPGGTKNCVDYAEKKGNKNSEHIRAIFINNLKNKNYEKQHGNSRKN